jgi:hypothetical protein
MQHVILFPGVNISVLDDHGIDGKPKDDIVLC